MPVNDLIKQCRYYKGEKQCPKRIEQIGMANIWFYEQLWVESEALRDEKGFNTEEYIQFGLKDFKSDDGVPLSLKSLLFNRHNHWLGGYDMQSDAESFKEWYNNNYIELTNNDCEK